MIKLAFGFCLFIFPFFSFSNELKPFVSDGCSMFPDGTLFQHRLWSSCCFVHDFAYWKGGTYFERKRADFDLKFCVANKGKPRLALLIFVGVRLGGSPFSPMPFRWGYGWRYSKFYSKLTSEDLKKVQAYNYRYFHEY